MLAGTKKQVCVPTNSLNDICLFVPRFPRSLESLARGANYVSKHGVLYALNLTITNRVNPTEARDILQKFGVMGFDPYQNVAGPLSCFSLKKMDEIDLISALV